MTNRLYPNYSINKWSQKMIYSSHTTRVRGKTDRHLMTPYEGRSVHWLTSHTALATMLGSNPYLHDLMNLREYLSLNNWHSGSVINVWKLKVTVSRSCPASCLFIVDVATSSELRRPFFESTRRLKTSTTSSLKKTRESESVPLTSVWPDLATFHHFGNI